MTWDKRSSGEERGWHRPGHASSLLLLCLRFPRTAMELRGLARAGAMQSHLLKFTFNSLIKVTRALHPWLRKKKEQITLLKKYSAGSRNTKKMIVYKFLYVLINFDGWWLAQALLQYCGNFHLYQPAIRCLFSRHLTQWPTGPPITRIAISSKRWGDSPRKPPSSDFHHSPLRDTDNLEQADRTASNILVGMKNKEMTEENKETG